MKVFIDANLLIYLNVMKKKETRLLIEDFYIRLLSEYRAYTDPLVLDEVLYISKKKYGVPYILSIDFIESIVKPYVTILSIGEEEYDKAKAIIEEYGIKPSDALHIATMENNGISKIASEDKELDKIKGLERIWL